MIIHRRLTLHGPDEGRIEIQIAHNDKPGARQEAEEVAVRVFANALTPYLDDLHVDTTKTTRSKK